MSIGHEDLNIPVGMQIQSPELVTTTFVGWLESNDSLALKLKNIRFKPFFLFPVKNVLQISQSFQLLFLIALISFLCFSQIVDLCSKQYLQTLSFKEAINWPYKEDCSLIPPNVATKYLYQVSLLVFNIIQMHYIRLNAISSQFTPRQKLHVV